MVISSNSERDQAESSITVTKKEPHENYTSNKTSQGKDTQRGAVALFVSVGYIMHSGFVNPAKFHLNPI